MSDCKRITSARQVKSTRRTRGAALASLGMVQRDGDTFLVGSQTQRGVTYRATANSCECQDAARGERCKHQHAVEIFAQAEGRAVEARFTGNLAGLMERAIDATRAAATVFEANCWEALSIACAMEARELAGGAE